MRKRYKCSLEKLTGLPEKMRDDINLTHGVIFAQRVLYKLIEKGFVREKAYDTVQPIAMKALETKEHYSKLLKEDSTVSSMLTNDEIDSCFTLDYYMKNVDYIFNRLNIK
jgi:adenylosuccinate lyase